MNNWIDISVPLRNGMPHWPGDQPFERHIDHDMSQGAGNNLSSFKTSVHTGTHMDAPLHFVAKGRSIDEFPLEIAVGPARVIKIQNTHEIPVSELEAAGIQEGERLLFRTENSTHAWNTDEFQKDFIAIPEATAKWLAARKPKLVGVDYLSVGPYEDGGPTHRAMLNAGIWIIEGLNLGAVEAGRYELICLPLKIQGGDGAPARAIIRAV
jgi:arylformamidase